MNSCRENPLFVWFIYTSKKKTPPIIQKFHAKRGWSKQIIHTPPNILEGNRVVFEKLVKKKTPLSLKNFMERGGIKKNYSYPQIILEGNGVVF